MITFNPDATLGFKAYRKPHETEHGMLSTEMFDFFSLTHFVECEKYASYDSDYYSYLSSMRDVESLLIETRGIPSELADCNFLPKRQQVTLCGVHFLITQNRFYFEDFLNFETELVCTDPELQEILIYYRKRHIFANDTKRVAVVGSKSVPKDNKISRLLTDSFCSDTPEEIVLSTSPGVSEYVEVFAHRNYIPISRGTARRKEDGRSWQQKRLERMANYSSEAVVIKYSDDNNKDANQFIQIMNCLNKPVSVVDA